MGEYGRRDRESKYALMDNIVLEIFFGRGVEPGFLPFFFLSGLGIAANGLTCRFSEQISFLPNEIVNICDEMNSGDASHFFWRQSIYPRACRAKLLQLSFLFPLHHPLDPRYRSCTNEHS